MEILKKNNHFVIAFKFHPRLVEAVKQLPERRFMMADKTWLVPSAFEREVLAFANRYNFKLTEDTELDPEEMPELEMDINLKMTPFPYQKKGIAYSLKHKRVIVGDQPGLGKTGQAIATVYAANAFPCLVICPSSLKENWAREFKMWTDAKPIILVDRIKRSWDQYYQAGLANVFIVNYESLKKYFVDDIVVPKGQKIRLKNIRFSPKVAHFKSVIIDESHRVKDPSTQQTKFTKGITDGKEYILALTGTPVINKPKDLIAQLSIIGQLSKFGGNTAFIRRFCAGERGASNLDELKVLLRQHCFYRREKSEVLKDLPAKIRQMVQSEITNRKEYQDAETNLISYLKEYKQASDSQVARAMRGEIMVQIGILKNISAKGKLRDVKEYISDIISSGEKLILFAHLKEVILSLKNEFPEAVSVTGQDSQAERQHAVDSFQNDSKTKLILCSIKAAGVGLTLTAASRVAFIELPWTAADCDQCEDRAHRIGQKDSVQCTYFLGKNTIDERIFEIIQAKREIANGVTGATDTVEENFIDDILNLYTSDSPKSKV